MAMSDPHHSSHPMDSSTRVKVEQPTLPIQIMPMPGQQKVNEETLRAMQMAVMNNIHEAIAILPAKEIAKLLDQNPDLISQEGFSGMFPIHKAVLKGDPSLVEILLNYGAFPNVCNNFDETPLHFACKLGNPVVVHKLINAGADLNAIDKNGRSPMHHAAQGGSVLCMHYLLEIHNLDPRVTDNNLITPLHLCCAHGHQEGIDYLLRNGRSNVNAVDVHGNTAMHIAGQYGQAAACWRLMELGGLQLLHQQNNDGLNPLQLAAQNSHHKNQNLVKLLDVYLSIKRKEGPAEGPTPLWYLLLLTPWLGFYVTLFISRYLDNPAIFVAFGLVLMGIFLYRQMHRIDHLCRWPNPVQAGLFSSGIFNTMLLYFSNVFDYVNTSNPVFAMFSALVCVLLTFMYYRLMTGDPGICRESARKSNGQLYTVMDIARGEVRLQALCSDCELIPPKRSRHCKLCKLCYLDCDHHCLFLYKCVARFNHRLFLYFILLCTLSMFVYAYWVFFFCQSLFPSVAASYAVFKAMQVYPGTVAVALMNLLSGLWLSVLFYSQLKLISKAHTTAHQPNRGRTSLTYVQRLKNISHFFAGKTPYAVDPILQA